MIAEIFYPKELKTAIRELKAKGDLNEDAVSEINKGTLLPLIFGAAVIIPICFLRGYDPAIIGIALLSVLGCAMTVQRSARIALSYTLGQTVQGKIEWIDFGKPQPESPKGWRFRYKFERVNGNIESVRFGTVLSDDMPSEISKVGDKIKVYVYTKKEKFNAPFLPRYFEKFCLSKEKIAKVLIKES